MVPFGGGVSGLGLGGVTKDDFVPRPFEEPDWATYLQQSGGLIVQLVTASGLDAGELLRFRSATHAVDVVADARGRASIAVMLPLSAAIEPVLLMRSDGRSLEGHVDVGTVSFERQLSLPGQLRDGSEPTRSGGVRLATHTRQGDMTHTLTAFGAVSHLRTRGDEAPLRLQPLRGRLALLNPQPLPPVESGDGEASLNPQPLPPVDAPDFTHRLALSAGIRGVTRIVPIPGFAESSVAVALMSDGTKLLLDVELNGSMRIAGTFSGLIGLLEVFGGWAVSESCSDVGVYRVSEPFAEPVIDSISTSGSPKGVEGMAEVPKDNGCRGNARALEVPVNRRGLVTPIRLTPFVACRTANWQLPGCKQQGPLCLVGAKLAWTKDRVMALLLPFQWRAGGAYGQAAAPDVDAPCSKLWR